MNFKDALAQFDLNWQVGLRGVYVPTKDNDLREVPGYKSVVRLDKDIPLSVVGSRYKVVQNDRCADIVDEVVRGLNCRYVNGGLFGDGSRLFMQAIFPDTIRVKGSKDDQIKKYLTFITSHDASLPTIIGGSSTRCVCENTFRMAFREARNDVRLRHTSNVEQRLDEAKDILESMIEYHNAVELKVNQLAATPFNDKMMNDVLRKVFEMDPKVPNHELPTRTLNSMNRVLENAQSGLGIDSSSRYTGWGILNSLTEFSNHQKVVRNEKDDPFARTESLLLGSGMEFNLRAQAAIEEVAGLS